MFVDLRQEKITVSDLTQAEDDLSVASQIRDHETIAFLIPIIRELKAAEAVIEKVDGWTYIFVPIRAKSQQELLSWVR